MPTTRPYTYRELTFVSGSASKLAEYRELLAISDLRWIERHLETKTVWHPVGM